MPRLNRRRPAGLLAASIGLVAAACGTDYIDLLPLSAGASAISGGDGGGGQSGGGHGGLEITAGGAGTSGTRAGMGGRPTSTAGDGGNAGTFQNGGKGGDGCVGFGCGGASGVAGGRGEQPCSDPSSPFCTPCDKNEDCPQQFNCNGYIELCRPACTPTTDCPNDGACDPMYGTCGYCFSDGQCQMQGNPRHNACEAGRCVQCNERVACEQGTCTLYQCLECTNDKDCTSGRCDKIRGRCLNAP